jgi:drug/metabolite transporter (DMT)-like permease
MALGGALLFSVNGSVSKITLQSGIDSMSLVLLRSAGAALALLLLVVLTDRSRLRLSRVEVPMLLVYGIVGIAMVQWLYFVAIARLPVGVALLLEFTGPVLVAFWVHFVQGQRLGRAIWFALALALGGLALVAEIWSGLTLNAIGVLAGIGAAMSLATYYIAGKNMLSSRDTLSVAFWAFVVAALFWSVIKPWWTIPWETLGAGVQLPGDLGLEVPAWGLVLWVVLLGTVAPFLLVVGALRRLPAAEAGVLGMAEPVLAGAVAWVWLDEILSPIQVVGSLVVIAGIVVAQRTTAVPEAAREVPERRHDDGVGNK